MTAAAAKTEAKTALSLGGHTFREFTGLDAAFGADRRDYPKYEDIPEAFKRNGNPHARVFSSLFFKGGKLDDHGLAIKPGTDRPQFYAALRALMSSFDPSHELKEATVAWLLAEYTTGEPSQAS